MEAGQLWQFYQVVVELGDDEELKAIMVELLNDDSDGQGQRGVP